MTEQYTGRQELLPTMSAAPSRLHLKPNKCMMYQNTGSVSLQSPVSNRHSCLDSLSAKTFSTPGMCAAARSSA